MQKDHGQEFDPSAPENFDVEEVSNASDEANDVVFAGIVETWELLELSEKAKLRPYIAGTVISIWAISLIASALRLLSTGSFLLLVPAAIILVPLYIVLKFYFKSG
jgi:hypothetical protein